MWDDGSGVVLKAEESAKEEIEQRKAEQKEEVRTSLVEEGGQAHLGTRVWSVKVYTTPFSFLSDHPRPRIQ